ncbi:hypothetical protein Tco_0696767, partial [Tanacetum coccineum]
DPEDEEFEEEEEPQEEEDDIEVDIEEDENEPKLTFLKCESSTSPVLQKDIDGLFPGLMRRDINSLFAKDEYYGKLILDLGNEVRSSVEQGTDVMEKLVEKLGNAKDEAESKKLKKELEEARLSNTFLLLRMQNERVERDLYWTRVRARELYQEMIRRGFMFEERPTEAIDVPVKDEECTPKAS